MYALTSMTESFTENDINEQELQLTFTSMNVSLPDPEIFYQDFHPTLASMIESFN